MAPTIKHRNDTTLGPYVTNGPTYKGTWSYTGFERTGWLVITNNLSCPIYVKTITGQLGCGQGIFHPTLNNGTTNSVKVTLALSTSLGDNAASLSGTSSDTVSITKVAKESDRKPEYTNSPPTGHIYQSVTGSYEFKFDGMRAKVPANSTRYVQITKPASPSTVVVQDWAVAPKWTWGTQPTKPTLTASSIIVKNGTKVTFTYDKDSNYISGTTEALYVSDKSTAEQSSKAQNAGTFTRTVNPGAGKSVTYQCRKYITQTAIYSDWSNKCTVLTYSNVSKPTLTLTPTNGIINGNGKWTVKWDSWTGTHGKTNNDTATYYDISIYTDMATPSKIYDVKSNATGTSYDISPDATKLLANYDNQNIRIRVTRKHDKAGYTAYSEVVAKARFKPIVTIPVETLGSVYNTHTDKPRFTYPTTDSSGNPSGVCSGIRVVFIDQTTGERLPEIWTTSGTPITLPLDKFVVNHTYTLELAPYYNYNNGTTTTKQYGVITTIPDYLTYKLESDYIPKILAPTGKGKWYGFNYKALIKMPKDAKDTPSNPFTPEQIESYRYKNLTVIVNDTLYNIKNNPDIFSKPLEDITYRDYIIVNIPNEASLNGANFMQVLCEYGTDNISDVAICNYIIDQEYPVIPFIPGEKILASNYDKLCNICDEMYLFSIDENFEAAIPDMKRYIDIKELRKNYTESNSVKPYAKNSKVSPPSQRKIIFAASYAYLLDILKAIYLYYSPYSAYVYELTESDIPLLNEQFSTIADIMGYSESLDVQTTESSLTDVITEFNRVYGTIGMPYIDNIYSIFSFYNVGTLENYEDYIGIIIKALGLAAYVYEMILRVLGIPMDVLLDLLREIERECRITYIGPDDREYTEKVFPITDEILALLVKRSIV